MRAAGTPTRSAALTAGAFALALVAALPVARAQDAARDANKTGAMQEGVRVGKAWARPTVHGAHAGAIYLTLDNPGADDALVAIDTDVADTAAVHESTVVDGIARMRPVPDGVPLPAHQAVTLRPEGLHIMIMGLKRQLLPGELFPATLHFRHAPDAHVTVKVLEAGATPPA